MIFRNLFGSPNNKCKRNNNLMLWEIFCTYECVGRQKNNRKMKWFGVESQETLQPIKIYSTKLSCLRPHQILLKFVQPSNWLVGMCVAHSLSLKIFCLFCHSVLISDYSQETHQTHSLTHWIAHAFLTKFHILLFFRFGLLVKMISWLWCECAVILTHVDIIWAKCELMKWLRQTSKYSSFSLLWKRL